jgi:hypothetical protein
MWQAPNQRVRAAANAKKRERERSRRPIHIKRINAHVELVNPNSPEPIKTETRLILNDLSTKGVGLFSPTPFIQGQDITITITDPLQITLKGKVIWCQEHGANSHVISNQPYTYRIGVEFILPSLEDQQSVKAFYEEVCKKYLYSIRGT